MGGRGVHLGELVKARDAWLAVIDLNHSRGGRSQFFMLCFAKKCLKQPLHLVSATEFPAGDRPHLRLARLNPHRIAPMIFSVLSYVVGDVFYILKITYLQT